MLAFAALHALSADTHALISRRPLDHGSGFTLPLPAGGLNLCLPLAGLPRPPLPSLLPGLVPKVLLPWMRLIVSIVRIAHESGGVYAMPCQHSSRRA